ncbi:MAG: hypothetical protein AB1847_13835 [bacterium]
MGGIRTSEGLSKNYAGSDGRRIGGFLRRSSTLTTQEKKRNLQIERLEILARYNAMNVEELRRKIREGAVPGLSAWEDLIEVKNIEAEMKELDNNLSMLPQV